MPEFDRSDRKSVSHPAFARGSALFIAILLGFLVWYAYSQWTDYWLLKDGQTVTATITDHSANGAVSYSYTVGGHVYRGDSGLLYPGSHQGTGDEIEVCYSVSHPWLSGLGKPTKIGVGLPAAMAVLLVLVAEILAVRTVISPRGKWSLDFGRRPWRRG